jgi:hypothetical protein
MPVSQTSSRCARGVQLEVSAPSTGVQSQQVGMHYSFFPKKKKKKTKWQVSDLLHLRLWALSARAQRWVLQQECDLPELGLL